MNIRDFFFNKSEDRYGSPGVRFGRFLLVLIPIFIVILLAFSSYTIIRPQYVGVKISLGQINPHPQNSGFTWMRPIIDHYEQMPIKVNSLLVTESTASADIQEVTTKLSIQYRLNPNYAPDVYQNYGSNPTMWQDTQLEPVLLEELKATTADWTAEQLIQQRPLVMQELWDHLTARFEPIGFTVVTVNIEDMQFSSKFTQAIEDKVVATQESLAEKNKVEIVRYQQIQQILAKQGEANRTIIAATANARQIEIQADADAYQIFVTYNATANGIERIKASLSDEYLQYLMIGEGWDGKLPLIMDSEGNMFLDVRSLLAENP